MTITDTAADLRRSEQRLQLALKAAQLGTWEFDLGTRRLTASPQCKANHGFRPDVDMQLDTHILAALTAEDAARFLAAIDDAVASGGSFELEVPNRWPDGTWHWLLVAGQVVEEGLLVGISKDITLRRNGEEALREADRRKDEFLAVLAHELRTPLAPIITAVRLLELQGPSDPHLQRLRGTILRQTLQLGHLVDDLLAVGRIITGKLTLHKTRVDLNAIVKQAIETCAPEIERRGHALAASFADPPVAIDVDGPRVVQVVCNLLSNAARYTPDGGQIEIAAFAEAGAAVVRVRDHGVGIAPDMLTRIFDRFVQAGSSSDRVQGGLGIGLWLVKALVDLHDGQVEACSAGAGAGSTFTVRLPI